jgi:hypothetical protein
MTKQEEMEEWGRTHYGAIWTALSNSVRFWEDAKSSRNPDDADELWMYEMAKSQHASYSKALAEFEELF